MNKSIWTIVTMGFMTVVVMIFMMLFSLTTYKGTTAGNQVRLANMIRAEFGFPEAGAGVRDRDGRLHMRIEYLAHTDSRFDELFMTAEMNRVVEFVRKRYEGKDRHSITSLRIRRLEVQGRGCWQSTLDREITVEDPFFVPPAPPPEEKPEEPPREDK